MKNILSTVWGLYFYFLRAGLMLSFYPAFRYYLLNEKNYPKAHRARRLAGNALLSAAGIKVKIINKGDINFDNHYIICANHASALDVFLSFKFPGTTCFLGKAELAELPFVDIFFKTIDIPVERENASAAARAFKKAFFAAEKGWNIVIFPEGGIFGDPNKLKPFKDGAFQLAIRKKISILPVTFINTWNVLPDTPFKAMPGTVKVILHQPVFTDELKQDDAEVLKQQVFNTINNTLLKYANN